jgi:hypothetical protein
MKNATVTLSPAICATCNGTGIEYDGAGHTCTACNGEPVPPAGEDVEVERFDMFIEWGSMEPTKNGAWVCHGHVTRLQAEVGRLKAEAGIYRTGYALLKEELTKAREYLKDLGVDWPEVSDMYQSAPAAKDESHEE